MINGLLGDVYPDAAILSEEVVEALEEARKKRTGKKVCCTDEDCRLSAGCTFVYVHLQIKLPVEEDWGSSDQWVVGIVSASMDEIRDAIQGEMRGFEFEELWATLEDAGAVAVVEGVVTLPHLAGKIATLDDFLKHLDRQRARLEKLEPVQDDLLEHQDELSRRLVAIKRSVENVLGVAESENVRVR